MTYAVSASIEGLGMGLELNVDTIEEGRIETLVEDALASETNETQRIRFSGGDVAEIRVREKPLFGLQFEIDLRPSEEQCNEISPADIQTTATEDEMAEIIDATEEVTKLSEAIDEPTYGWLVREIAAGKDVDASAVRETLDEMALCSQVFDSGDHYVASFFAYV